MAALEALLDASAELEILVIVGGILAIAALRRGNKRARPHETD